MRHWKKSVKRHTLNTDVNYSTKCLYFPNYQTHDVHQIKTNLHVLYVLLFMLYNKRYSIRHIETADTPFISLTQLIF